MHQQVGRRRHLTFQQFFGRFGRLLLRSLPFGEVQNGATFVHVALNEPRCWRDARVGGPLCLVAVAVEARLLGQGPGRRGIPRRLAPQGRVAVVATVRHQLNRQEGAEQAKTNPGQPPPVEDVHRHLHGMQSDTAPHERADRVPASKRHYPVVGREEAQRRRRSRYRSVREAEGLRRIHGGMAAVCSAGRQRQYERSDARVRLGRPSGGFSPVKASVLQ